MLFVVGRWLRKRLIVYIYGLFGLRDQRGELMQRRNLPLQKKVPSKCIHFGLFFIILSSRNGGSQCANLQFLRRRRAGKSFARIFLFCNFRRENNKSSISEKNAFDYISFPPGFSKRWCQKGDCKICGVRKYFANWSSRISYNRVLFFTIQFVWHHNVTFGIRKFGVAKIIILTLAKLR